MSAKTKIKGHIATNIYITEEQHAKVKRMIAQQQKKDSEKMGRPMPALSFTQYMRLLIDQQKEGK